jgi:hypothetical protein
MWLAEASEQPISQAATGLRRLSNVTNATRVGQSHTYGVYYKVLFDRGIIRCTIKYGVYIYIYDIQFWPALLVTLVCTLLPSAYTCLCAF